MQKRYSTDFHAIRSVTLKVVGPRTENASDIVRLTRLYLSHLGLFTLQELKLLRGEPSNHEDACSMFLQNIDTQPEDYTSVQVIRP